MKKVLFLMQSYPAQRSANAICDQKIISEMKRSGEYEIHCQTFLRNGQTGFEEIDGVKVHRVKKSNYWLLFTKAKKNSQTTKSKIILKLDRILLRIKQILTIPFYPCYEPFWVKKFAKKAIELQKKEQFDLVIAEHNGLETLNAGAKIKEKFPKTKFISIFWDSLSGGFNAKYLPSSYCKKKKLLLEKKILETSDLAIMMDSHKEFVTKSHTQNIQKICFLNIPYLEEKQIPKNCTDSFINKEKINFVFSGSLGNRNINYLVELFEAVDDDNINLWFICDSFYHKKVQETVKKPNCVKVHEYINNVDLQQVLYKADFLVNIGVDNPNAISGKIFEYMSFGKPIISTYFIDNEACLSYLKKYPLALCIDERKSIQCNAEQLKEFIKLNMGKTVSFADVKKLFPENTSEKYVEIINKLMGN